MLDVGCALYIARPYQAFAFQIKSCDVQLDFFESAMHDVHGICKAAGLELFQCAHVHIDDIDILLIMTKS